LRFRLQVRLRFRRRGLLVLIATFIATGCGDGLVQPSTLGPILVCPMPVTVASPDGGGVAVVYEFPQVIAGEPPLRTSCSPASGTIFPFGTTPVTCTTRDSVGRTANPCSFTVTVAAAPRLSATSFMAFGNSITEGKNGTSQIVANPYPAVLRSLLAARYVAQTITVVNRGVGGEWATDGSDRVKRDLDAFHPEVLLLEEGINDILGGDPLKVPQVGDALRDMVQKAKARGVRVFLATLLPTRAGSQRGKDAFSLVPLVNVQIRSIAQIEGVTLVDLYAGFGGSADPYIDIDGLHPTEEGYQKMAEIFFAAIRSTLELRSTSPLGDVVRSLPAPEPPFAAYR
jgi:lysophospholipase L1-like esterase